jgi:cation diffusion facilitator CzcD-associated flavoprotein CzcO
MLEEMDYVPTARYATGEEIRRHLDAIAHRYDLVNDALFHTGVETSEWDEDGSWWVLHTDRGDEIRARYLVVAPGILNLVKLPRIPGMEGFQGKAFHTARWDYEYTGGAPDDTRLTKLSDKVVGIIGTGGSAVQCVPPLAESSKHLYVFQRTPSAIGVRGNRPTDERFAQQLHPGWQRKRMENFSAVMIGRDVGRDLTDDGWTHHMAKVANPRLQPGMSPEQAMRKAEEIDYAVMEEHRARVDQIVSDPTVAEALKPYYRYLCKRPLFHDEYLQTFNRPDVTLVDCPSGVERVTEHGVVANATEYELDCIVYATGFEGELTPFPRRASHDSREVEGRRDQPARDHDVRLPQHVHHAGARTAGRDDGQLHPPRRHRRRAHRGHDREARRARREGLRREPGGRGRLDEDDRLHFPGRPRLHGHLHPVPLELRGRPEQGEPAQWVLRRRLRRLLRL